MLWIGASDTASKGTWIWDSTGNKMSPGYQGWLPARPFSSCSVYSSYDCAIYHYDGTGTIPMWGDVPCTVLYSGGICELQPSNSSIF